MEKFSERYGYTTASQVIIREQLPEPIINSILNWFDDNKSDLEYTNYNDDTIDGYISVVYLVNREFLNLHMEPESVIAEPIVYYLKNSTIKWYDKLNLIEFLLPHLKYYIEMPNMNYSDPDDFPNYNSIINNLNSEFERHNFAYRIIDNKVVEITSQVEIDEIDKALTHEHKGVQTHLQAALRLLSAGKEAPDNYRNSIKESISAVEACCKKITGESTLGKALPKLENKGVVIHKQIINSLENFYIYTNDPSTGIRHAVAVIDEKHTPTSEDAIFMLVSCSAFVNYITAKKSTQPSKLNVIG